MTFLKLVPSWQIELVVLGYAGSEYCFLDVIPEFAAIDTKLVLTMTYEEIVEFVGGLIIMACDNAIVVASEGCVFDMQHGIGSYSTYQS